MFGKCDFISANKHIGVLVVIDVVSWIIIDGKVENLGVEIKNPRVGLLLMLCLEKLYVSEAAYKDTKVDTVHGKKLGSIDLVKPFQDRNWFE